MNYRKHFSTKETTQSEAIPGRESEMKTNNAGGVTFTIDDWARLDRFLMIGSEKGTYYVTEQKLTIDNAQAVLRCLKTDGLRVVNRTVEISHAGRAPKNDQALFVLAMASADEKVEVRQAAVAALPKVARIGTHLFQFAEYVEGFRGWGKALRKAVANWYLEMPVEKLANQAVKYQQRNGWAHRDLLRLSHPKTADTSRNAIFKFMSSKDNKLEINTDSKFIAAYQEIQKIDKTDVKNAIRLITEANLPREAIPTEFLNDVGVWEALLEDMPMTAMIRNLGKMSSIGLLKPMSAATKKVLSELGSMENLRKARVHPINVLVALKTYAQGAGFRGSLSWTPVTQITDALDAAFYLAFGNVEPSNKNILYGVDCSGSMGGQASGTEVLRHIEVAAALALVSANVESSYEIMGFSSGAGFKSPSSGGYSNSGLKDLGISPKMRLDQVTTKMLGLAWGGTDCALPMMYGVEQNQNIDAFVVITDNETWAGAIQPSQALQKYRQKSGKNAKSVVIATAATEFTIADPKDAGMMDVSGFDLAVPNILSSFIKD